MAFNEILVGRVNRFAQKFLQIKNTALRSLSPDLQTVLQLENSIETDYLQSWYNFATVQASAAVAAQFSAFRVRNPATSGIVAVFRRIWYNAGQLVDGPFLYLQPATTDLGTIDAMSAIRMDPRGNPSSSLIFSHGTAVQNALGASFMTRVCINASQTNAEFIPHAGCFICLLPGDVMTIVGNVVNQATNIAYQWRERTLESSELT